MFKPGLICQKTKGQKEFCVVVDIEKNFAVVDNGFKRRRCNIMHLEPVAFAEIKKGKGLFSEQIKEILKEVGFENKFKRSVKEKFKRENGKTRV